MLLPVQLPWPNDNAATVLLQLKRSSFNEYSATARPAPSASERPRLPQHRHLHHCTPDVRNNAELGVRQASIAWFQVPVGVTLSVGKCPKGLERDVITIKSTSTVPLEEVSVGIVNTNSASEVWYRLDTIKPGESKTVMPIEADNFAFSRVPYELGLTDTIVVKAKNLYEIRFPVKDLGKDKLFDRKRDGER